jgi:hypothetical protein
MSALTITDVWPGPVQRPRRGCAPYRRRGELEGFPDRRFSRLPERTEGDGPPMSASALRRYRGSVCNRPRFRWVQNQVRHSSRVAAAHAAQASRPRRSSSPRDLHRSEAQPSPLCARLVPPAPGERFPRSPREQADAAAVTSRAEASAFHASSARRSVHGRRPQILPSRLLEGSAYGRRWRLTAHCAEDGLCGGRRPSC